MPLISVHPSHEPLVLPDEAPDGVPRIAWAGCRAVGLPGEVAGGLVHAAGTVGSSAGPLVRARVVAVGGCPWQGGLQGFRLLDWVVEGVVYDLDFENGNRERSLSRLVYKNFVLFETAKKFSSWMY